MDKVTGIKLGTLRDQLQKIAKLQNRTLSGMIKHILSNWLKRNGRRK